MVQCISGGIKMSKIIGIDLGTTNSVIAVMEGGDPTVISTSEGTRTMPSVVAFNKNGERLVGQTAKRQSVTNPQNTIYSIKRLMGLRADQVTSESGMVSYEIVSGPKEDARVKIPQTDKTYTPQEISGMILAKLKSDAESYLGTPVTQAVITVPAYFSDSQRQATKDAGKIAGLEVMRIINEPTAAALAYGLESNANEKILVFDLGGGTFDVSVLEVAEGVVEVEATNGDTHLGGDDWDQAILDWAADKFKQDQGIDLRNDKQALQRLREASEKAKIELSSMQQTEINLPFITADADGPKHMQINLGRSEFEQLTQNLVQKLKGPFESALKDAGVSASDIDQVVLVGGSTRMPMVQDLVEQLTGKSPHKGVNPDEVVAIGAAIQGGVLGGEVKDVLLLDVTPLTLGLETLGEVMTPLIERNTTVPVKKNEVFSTAADNQTAVDIHVLQGERSMAADNMSLGRFRLEGIPAAPRGMPQIEVTFDIDSNGILSVTAQDKATGTKQQITITASTNLDDSEIENMVNAARQNEAEDRKVKELVEARNEADSIAYSAEKALNELGENLDSDERNTIENQIQELREVSQGEDINKIKEISQTLQQASHTLSQQAAANAQENATSNDDSENDKPDDEDVVEGEFTEA
tara:strand:+ start:203 stop:2122 length:1920 start_codon:yes stop_codon:yes gene_type:complete